MELCQTCPKNASKNCHQICPAIKDYLKGKRNYKTTYVNKEDSISVVHENEDRDKKVYPTLSDFLDDSGSFTEKFGHLLPMIEKIVEDYGTKRQAQVWDLYLHEHMSLGYIATLLYMKRQSVHEVLYGRRGQGGLIRKIQKHLRKSGKLPALN